MSETRESNGRLTLNASGAVQFFAGALSSYPFFTVVVGVPALVAVRVFESESGVLLAVVIAAAIGTGLCLLLGKWLAGHAQVGWLAILGAETQPIYVVLRAVFNTELREYGMAPLSLAWAIPGAALALAFWQARRNRQLPAVQETSRAPEEGSA
jgi:hypothetical protein